MSTALTERGNSEIAQADPVTTDDFLLRLVTSPDVDPAKLQAIMGVIERRQEEQRRERADLAMKAYRAAKARMQAELPIIGRDAQNPQTKSRYARLESIWEECCPIWTRHGFDVSFQATSVDGGLVRVTLMLGHEGGHVETFTAPDAPPDDRGIAGTVNKTMVQGNQATVTYIKRGLLCNALGIVTRLEDDDGNSGTRRRDEPPAGGVARHQSHEPEQRQRHTTVNPKSGMLIAGQIAKLMKISDDAVWRQGVVDVYRQTAQAADLDELDAYLAQAMQGWKPADIARYQDITDAGKAARARLSGATVPDAAPVQTTLLDEPASPPEAPPPAEDVPRGPVLTHVAVQPPMEGNKPRWDGWFSQFRDELATVPDFELEVWADAQRDVLTDERTPLAQREEATIALLRKFGEAGIEAPAWLGLPPPPPDAGPGDDERWLQKQEAELAEIKLTETGMQVFNTWRRTPDVVNTLAAMEKTNPVLHARAKAIFNQKLRELVAAKQAREGVKP